MTLRVMMGLLCTLMGFTQGMKEKVMRPGIETIQLAHLEVAYDAAINGQARIIQ